MNCHVIFWVLSRSLRHGPIPGAELVGKRILNSKTPVLERGPLSRSQSQARNSEGSSMKCLITDHLPRHNIDEIGVLVFCSALPSSSGQFDEQIHHVL